ncbi:MAG: hypothetical protein HYS60_02070 [Candidatus Wildermuthbacteria bacterium]|nr:hypothetical protein [Candidatus Wildermuthbacteria bacterium]
MKKIWRIIGISVFILLALGVWFWQRNSYSKADLKFEIIAPKEATAGEEITYTVQWKNNGQISLENPVLVFEYPQGSVPSDGNSLRNTIQVSEIYPGQEQTKQFKGRLFGKEGSLQEARASLTYAPKNINARYEAETKGASVISFVPLSFELDMPSRTESSQQFSFALNYFSNSEYPLSDLRIKIEYPEGFEFAQAAPSPIGEDEWKLGILNKAEGGRITVRGKLEGKLQEAKIFRATLGSWKDGEFTLLKDSSKGVEITKPQIQISQVINGNTPLSVSPGQTLHYEISFKNVSERNLENLFLIVALEGNAFDFSTLQASEGSFQSGDNSVVWEAQDVPKLRFLGKGETGKVEFWIAIRQDAISPDSEDSNLTARNRILLSEAREEFEVKVNSKLVIEQKGYYQDEVFGNEGPLPPQPESKTTYTIVWQAKNYFNNVKNVKVKSILPQNVELTGKVFPGDSHLTFDSGSREVVWGAGDLLAGAGVFSQPLSVAFQVSLSPFVSQRGSPAQLMGQAQITGDDTWTAQSVTGSASAIDTTIPNDSSAQGKGIVQ